MGPGNAGFVQIRSEPTPQEPRTGNKLQLVSKGVNHAGSCLPAGIDGRISRFYIRVTLLHVE